MAEIGRAGATRHSTGDAALVAFLLAQACDGVAILPWIGILYYW